jgi:hypothetical protein
MASRRGAWLQYGIKVRPFVERLQNTSGIIRAAYYHSQGGRQRGPPELNEYGPDFTGPPPRQHRRPQCSSLHLDRANDTKNT